MKDFKTFYYNIGADGGSGGEGASGIADAQIDTPTVTQDTQTDQQTNSNIDTIFAEQPNAEAQAPPENVAQANSYEFEKLESFQGNEEYFTKLSEKFSEYGVTQEQAPNLVALADEILVPLIENYEEKLKGYEDEETVAKNLTEHINSEIKSMTTEELNILENVKNVALGALTPDEFLDFGSSFQDKNSVLLFGKILNKLTGGVNENASGTGYNKKESTMTLDTYTKELSKYMGDHIPIAQFDEAKKQLNERARISGNQELQEYLKM